MTTRPMEHAVVCAYMLPDETKIEAAAQTDGTRLWAVRHRNLCLDHDGNWEFEPMVSYRDDEFLARCRWPTAETAYQAWQTTNEKTFSKP